jgi:ankyrin repeat protein
VVEILIEHGADVHARVSSGETALFATYDVEIARVLVRHGADINARRASGESVLRLARRFALQLKGSNSYMRPQVATYEAWLESQGAVE